MTVNMITACSNAMSVRLFVGDLDLACHFAEWLNLNGFGPVVIDQDVKAEEHPRTEEEEETAHALVRAYELWNSNATAKEN